MSNQRTSIGKKIINTLENDEFFLRAKRIEIPTSITGVPFYIKMVSVNQTKNI